jgi:polar amino acid transport system substrate-binding protein
MRKNFIRLLVAVLLLPLLAGLYSCKKREKITQLEQLGSKEFAVPTGTVADKLVLSRFPNAKFQYFNSVLDAAMAVKSGKVDAVAYDEPILKNIAAKNPGLIVLPGMITNDSYGFAVPKSKPELKKAIDLKLAELRKNGTYDAMLLRWLPKTGSPGKMPAITSSGSKGVLRLGTAAVTEPFSFVDGSHAVAGLDIELAAYVAQQLDMKLEIVNMEFGALIPALISGKVDMIAACITITEERAQKVLFSEPYYAGGIAALVSQ